MALEHQWTHLWGCWCSTDPRMPWGEHTPPWGPSVTHSRVSAGCRQGTWGPAGGEELGQLQPAPLCSQLVFRVQNAFLAAVSGHCISS